MKKNIFKFTIFIIISSFLIFLDQITKYYVTKNLKNGGIKIFFNDIFEIFYYENNGAAFGILKGWQLFFYIITIIVFLLIFYYIYKLELNKKMLPLFLDIILIFSGAAGNFIDRIRLKYVIDFIYFKPIDFPVFNVADSYITVGCFIFIFLVLFVYKNEDIKF